MPKVKHITPDPMRDLIRNRIADSGLKLEKIAELMAITRVTLNTWLNHRSIAEWRVSDLKRMCKVLGIDWTVARNLL